MFFLSLYSPEFDLGNRATCAEWVFSTFVIEISKPFTENPRG